MEHFVKCRAMKVPLKSRLWSLALPWTRGRRRKSLLYSVVGETLACPRGGATTSVPVQDVSSTYWVARTPGSVVLTGSRPPRPTFSRPSSLQITTGVCRLSYASSRCKRYAPKFTALILGTDSRCSSLVSHVLPEEPLCRLV